MFEQSVVEARTLTARPWTLGVSVLGQAVLITAAVVLPMLHPETLQRVVTLVPIGRPPGGYKPPATATREATRHATSGPRTFQCKFCAPARIPATISTTADASSAFADLPAGPAWEGVPGGFGPAGPAFGAGAGQQVLPPPEPKPKPAPVVRPVVKQAPPPPVEPVRRGGDVQASLLIYKPEPPYPPLARQARIQGAVHLTALISTEGRITSLRAIDGHPLLVRAAIDAVKQWEYRPTLLNGIPVEVITEITVTFTLNN